MSKLPKLGVRRVREANLSRTLGIIHQAGSISRAEICQATGLSATTVSLIVDALLSTGIVHESGTGKSSGGRPPILVQFDYSHRYLLGVDMGATQLTAILMDLGGEMKSRASREFDVVNDPAGTIEALTELVEQVMDELGLSLSNLLGMGIAVAAPLEGELLDRPSPIVQPAWQDFDLVGSIQESHPFTIRVENDANAGAIAEKWWGKGTDHDNLAYIKLGTGVGGGLILDGAIYRGDGGTAGEIGHVPIDLNGPPCRCGRRGCLEAFVGVPSLITKFQELYREANQETPPVELRSIQGIIKAAQNGNPLCQETLEYAGSFLGIGLTNLVNLFNPGLIILGGKLAEAGDLLVHSVHQTIHEHAMQKALQEVEITFSGLGDDSVAIGAATTVLEHAFNPGNISQIVAS